MQGGKNPKYSNLSENSAETKLLGEREFAIKQKWVDVQDRQWFEITEVETTEFICFPPIKQPLRFVLNYNLQLFKDI